MNDQLGGTMQDERASRARVARGALRQAERHERAIEACLAELDGTGSPDLGHVAFMLRRARRHVDRAQGLAQMAARISHDPDAAPLLAASVERHERNALRVASWPSQ